MTQWSSSVAPSQQLPGVMAYQPQAGGAGGYVFQQRTLKKNRRKEKAHWRDFDSFMREQEHNGPRQRKLEWKCSKCGFTNWLNKAICRMCNQGFHPDCPLIMPDGTEAPFPPTPEAFQALYTKTTSAGGPSRTSRPPMTQTEKEPAVAWKKYKPVCRTQVEEHHNGHGAHRKVRHRTKATAKCKAGNHQRQSNPPN